MPSLTKFTHQKVENNEYLRHIKNFVLLYNEQNQHKMAYIKKSIGFQYVLGNQVLRISTFFGEFEDFGNAKAQNIFFITLNSRVKPIDFRETIIFTRIIGQWALSDVILGKDKGEMDIQFHDIFKEDDVKFILDEKIVKNILDNKDYITDFYYQRGFPKREFKTFEPEVVVPTKAVRVQLGDNCLRESGGKLHFGSCHKATTFDMKDGKIKHGNKCVSFHGNGEVELIDCEAPTECRESGGNCNKFKPRKFGGMEIAGTGKCLNSTKYSSECHSAQRVKLL